MSYGEQKMDNQCMTISIMSYKVSALRMIMTFILSAFLYSPLAMAQDANEDSDPEQTDEYYRGSIRAICKNAASKTESLVNAKDYCMIYPKNCIENRAVCLNGMPINALRSNSREKIYKKNVSSYIKNQKTVCHDFPWTCPMAKELSEAIEVRGDLFSFPEIRNQLPKNADICMNDNDCKQNEICALNNPATTAYIQICKNPDNVKCTNNTHCPNESFCHHGQCIECLENDKVCADGECFPRVIKPGMKCSKGKWIPDGKRAKLPCSGSPPCPAGFGMANIRLIDGSEKCECWFSGNNWKKQTFEDERTCKSNMDCSLNEVCNSFYGKCLDNTDPDYTRNYYLNDIQQLPYESEKTISEERKRIIKELEEERIRSKKQIMDDLMNEPMASETVDYCLGMVYLKAGLHHISKAFKYLKAAADKGHKEAQLVVGLMYIYGQGTSRNENKGFWYLNRVFKPEQSVPTSAIAYSGALMELIKCYYYGIGTPKDEAKAQELTTIFNDKAPDTFAVMRYYESMSIDRFSEYTTLEEMRQNQGTDSPE